MNLLILKKAILYSLILGIIFAFFGSFNSLIGLVALALGIFCAPCVIFFMKFRKEIGFLDNQQGAVLGVASGFFATISFFLVFTPLTIMLSNLTPVISKKIKFIGSYHYSYGLPYLITPDSFWLFVVIVIAIAALVALTNSTTGMGATFILAQIEKKPENIDEIDINIE